MAFLPSCCTIIQLLTAGKNASLLQVQRLGTQKPFPSDGLDNPSSNLVWLLLLRAADKFFETRQRFPGFSSIMAH